MTERLVSYTLKVQYEQLLYYLLTMVVSQFNFNDATVSLHYRMNRYIKRYQLFCRDKKLVNSGKCEVLKLKTREP